MMADEKAAVIEGKQNARGADEDPAELEHPWDARGYRRHNESFNARALFSRALLCTSTAEV